MTKNLIVGIVCLVIGLAAGWVAGHHRVQKAIDAWTQVQSFMEDDRVFGNQLSEYYIGEALDEAKILRTLENGNIQGANEILIEHLTRHYQAAKYGIETGEDTKYDRKLIDIYKRFAEKSEAIRKIVEQ